MNELKKGLKGGFFFLKSRDKEFRQKTQSFFFPLINEVLQTSVSQGRVKEDGGRPVVLILGQQSPYE